MNPHLGFWLGVLVFAAGTPNAQAWEQHQLFQETALSALRGKLERIALPPVSLAQDAAIRAGLLRDLHLNDRIPKTRAARTAWDMLVSLPTIDEPDSGMDQDIPASEDPTNDRAWMGGAKGAYSQGFRHMLFLGWGVTDPLASFQIPFRKLGQADQRAGLLFERARELQRQGHNAWAWRVLGWSLHFVQDLSQPFHSTQVPHPRLVPWGVLKPSQDGVKAFIAATTSQLGREHTEFEKRIQALWISGAIRDECAPQFRAETSGEWAHLTSVSQIALATAKRSHRHAWAVGAAIVEGSDDYRAACNALQLGLGATQRVVELFLQGDGVDRTTASVPTGR